MLHRSSNFRRSANSVRRRSTSGRAFPRRRAVLSLELLLVLPLLFGVVLGLVELSMIASANQRIKTASALACRIATFPATSDDALIDAVQNVVDNTLRRHSLKENCHITLTPGQSTGDDVVVEITLPMIHAAPNMLAFLGFSLEDRQLFARTVMRKE